MKLRPPLTWKMLKERIEKMTEEEQNELVRVCIEDYPILSNLFLEKNSENWYYHDDFESAIPESDLDSYKPEDCELFLEKGKYIICQ